MSRHVVGVAPARWLRRRRHSARMRLTAVYAGLFLISGLAMLAITYLLVRQWPLDRNFAPTGRLNLPGGLPKAELLRLQRNADLHQLVLALTVALVAVALASIALGWIVAGRVLRPLRTITTTARRISATNLRERLALDGADDEFKRLGDTLDDLFSRLQASFEAQRHFVANASHELRTPLTAERTLLQVALANPNTTAERWRSTGFELLASSQEQERLMEALLTIATGEAGLHEPVRLDLAAITSRALRTPRPDIDRLGLNIDASLQPAAVEGEALLLERLVANLIDNAVRHNTVGGQVSIATRMTDGHAVLSIANTGPVVPLTEIDRLLQPFQRLDRRRTHHNGHGLGLSIVRAIAAAHRARLTVHPGDTGGLEVDVRFRPLTDPGELDRDATPLTEPQPARSPSLAAKTR